MNQISRLIALLPAIILAACTEQVLPVFGESVPLMTPAGKPAYGPRISQADHDGAILSWMERKEIGASLRFSEFTLGDWQAAGTAVVDEGMFVNSADLPAVNEIGSDALLAYWLSYTADATYSYQVLTSFSKDKGESWSTPVSPHTDGTLTEHGFVSSFEADTGTGLVWLDGRETPDAGMTLRGATLSPDGSLSDEALLDDLVCDCCQTDVAMTESGAILAYRNRTEDEIRDIYVARRVNGEWLPGAAVSDDRWEIAGCPVNGASIAANGKNVLVVWFSGANNTPIVKAAISTNSGKSFSEPVEIASKGAIGRVGATPINRHSFAISWLESDKKGTYAINLRGLTLDGQLSRVETIGRTSLARTLPQLVRVGGDLIFAWTDEMNEIRKVASVRVPIIGFYD